MTPDDILRKKVKIDSNHLISLESSQKNRLSEDLPIIYHLILKLKGSFNLSFETCYDIYLVSMKFGHS